MTTMAWFVVVTLLGVPDFPEDDQTFIRPFHFDDRATCEAFLMAERYGNSHDAFCVEMPVLPEDSE